MLAANVRAMGTGAPGEPERRVPPRWRRALRWLAVASLAGVGLGLGYRYGAYVTIYVRNMRVRAEVQERDVGSLGGPLLVVAPHPDDETLGCSGLIQQAVAEGTEVFVLLMTNGDGYEYERTVTAAGDVFHGVAEEHLDIGRSRQQETLRSMRAVGLPSDHVIFLGYPDGGVHEMWQPAHWPLSGPYRSPHTDADHNPYANSLSPGAPHSGAQVMTDLLTVLNRTQPTAVFTTAPFDVHRDHWATYGFVRLAVGEWDRREGGQVPVYGFLVHRHDWPAPQGDHPDRPLAPPAAWVGIQGVDWWRLNLTPGQVDTKSRCLAKYRTQNAGHSAELLSFVRGNELFSAVSDQLARGDRLSIPDPVRDLPPDRVQPAEDIAELRVDRMTDGWAVTLRLAARPSPELRYAVVWHQSAGNAHEAHSLVWHKGRVELWSAARDHAPQSARVPGEAQGTALVAQVPREAFAGPEILLEAYSKRGAHYLNHTMTVWANIEAADSQGSTHATRALR